MLASVLGRTVAFRSSADPPGSWAVTFDDVALAELAWEDGIVRVETPEEVGRVSAAGTWMVRAVLAVGEADEPRAWYVGGIHRGLARCREGRGFTRVRGIERGVGPWEGFDDEVGRGVLRIRNRMGGGGVWSEIAVTPDHAFDASAGSLLVVWAALKIVGLRRPWLSVTSSGVTERAVQREIARLDARLLARRGLEDEDVVAAPPRERGAVQVVAEPVGVGGYSPATTRLRPSALAR